ncbi:DUF2188 domain-containing protein [Mycoplasma mycoides subsp. mycoides]|uniref:DUF2188 domain-containing protein n=2 Tax=Mycoplasma mycoides subsp. mycoides TaxID=2103 RepID=Q6MUE8_MYCMS|nr:DUF2188 domain-containing protein [Mycoplasma mycoides]CAE76736.1 Conserved HYPOTHETICAL PROTEIN [Mycoplasma mycoides subsp. mycoides SC str. PG1]ADK69053.1 conserved hypothetical protein [Mycoplasma mycoides subsp. mycoides SC str. Gladysdale]AIZ54916.1 hypothetical protein mycmycITA_00085 [Mycoplasma mycoides subsp. mycoides]AME10291.1 hypothetical protein MmmBen_0086 [Mycoplasma mycoides subsp. mycoides]AME11296.1 hypothetical protein MmmBen50_0085 [Mycoplasma mycoides subsp. mycoides]
MAEKQQATVYPVTSYDGKWQVKGVGNTRPTKLFDTQKEAIAYANELTKKRQGSVIIHRTTGQVRDSINNKDKKK